MQKTRIVILGATSGIAEQCARLWAVEKTADFFLVGRDLEKIELIAQDLRVRSPDSEVLSRVCEFTEVDQISALIKEITTGGSIDIALIAFGSLPEQNRCQQDLQYCREQLLINGLATVLCAEAFASVMQVQDSGTLVTIGSVAGDRGRKSNYTYGAAKGFVSCYIEGLQHRLAKTDVTAIMVKPGPTDTPMTAHLKQQGARLASASSVARDIVNGVEKQRPLIYSPFRWRIIMAVIRHIPSFLFNKLEL